MYKRKKDSVIPGDAKRKRELMINKFFKMKFRIAPIIFKNRLLSVINRLNIKRQFFEKFAEFVGVKNCHNRL